MKKTISKLFMMCTFVAMLASCATQPKVAYFQDMAPGTEEKILHEQVIRIQPEDKISILVNSKDPALTNLFNLPYVTRHLGQVEGQTYGTPQGVSGYTVDSEGNINFPVLGEIHIAGLTREEIAKTITEKLVTSNMVKDPVVTVEFMNLTVSVLGEVNQPGRFLIDKDKVTLLDAISQAGDLTIYGEREKVFVQREENGNRKLYQVNLNSGYDLYSSPVYYLQQNDVVYVEPNKYRAKDSTVNNKALRWSSIWIGIASLLTTITVAIVK